MYEEDGAFHLGGLAGNAGTGGFVGVWVDFEEGGYFLEGMGGDGELQAAVG